MSPGLIVYEQQAVYIEESGPDSNLPNEHVCWHSHYRTVNAKDDSIFKRVGHIIDGHQCSQIQA